MLYDLGMNHKYFDDMAMVRKKVEELEEELDLVMIAEHFQESLVLLRKDLCWGVEDVTSFPLNGRKEEFKTKLSETAKSLLRDYLKSDYLLYNHFLKVFKEKVEKFGMSRMESEVATLKKANDDLFVKCSVEATANKELKGAQHWYGPGDLVGYNVNAREECKLMTMSGLSYIDRIREKQIERAKTILDKA